MATKATKACVLPKFWISKRFYKKQPVKKIWGRILRLAWLKFDVAALHRMPDLMKIPMISVKSALMDQNRCTKNI